MLIHPWQICCSPCSAVVVQDTSFLSTNNKLKTLFLDVFFFIPSSNHPSLTIMNHYSPDIYPLICQLFTHLFIAIKSPVATLHHGPLRHLQVLKYLPEYDTKGLDMEIMSPAEVLLGSQEQPFGNM